MHYDDPNQDLQDLYFIDPQWLCELMAQIVTLQEVNPYINHGILNLDNLPQIFKGELFAHQNSPQFIRLLNRFQIACSLDKNRVLIPSKLPVKQPEEATNDDLPFITLKRFHSFPCIPHGFWSRLISRLLFYMKDMLSDGEHFNRQEYTSPFQLDPFCCRCPLVLESSASAESDNEALTSIEASIGGSFENLQASPGDFRGLVRFFSSHRQGTYINGRFFGYSDLEGGSSRSDSGFEYSSDDDVEAARARTGRGALNATFPRSVRSRDVSSWRNEEIFKHSTDPGVRRGDDKVGDLDSGTPKSESAMPNMRQDCPERDVDGRAHFGASRTSSEEGSCVTVNFDQSHISPDAAQGPLVPENEPLAGSTGKHDDFVDSPRREGLANNEAGEDIKDAGDLQIIDYSLSACKETCLESCSQKLDAHLDATSFPGPGKRDTGNEVGLDVSPSQICNSDDSDSMPYHSVTSRSCTPDPFPREQTDGHYKDPSSVDPSEDPEIRPPHEAPGAEGPYQFQPLTEACSEEANSFHRSVSEENGDNWELVSDHTASSSMSNSMFSDKESSGESYHTGSSRESSLGEEGDTSTEIQTNHGDEELAGNENVNLDWRRLCYSHVTE